MEDKATFVEDKRAALFILSYKRADRLLKNITTLQWISDAWRAHTFLVVREEEIAAYEPVAGFFGVRLIAIPASAYEDKEFFGWGETMDWIVEYAIKRFERFIIADDDLKLSYRPNLEERVWLPLTKELFDTAMNTLLLTDYAIPFMGFRERQFSDLHKTEHEDNARFIHIFSLYSPFFKANPQYRYTTGDIRHMPDLQLLLSLLTNGIRIRCWNRFCHDDVPDAKGGCSEIRTSEEHSKSAVQLHRMFPELVALRQKTNWGDVRIGTTISWKKAFNFNANKAASDD